MQETTATVEDLVYGLLNGILEEKAEIINEHLPSVINDICKNTKWGLEDGLSKFIQEISDYYADSPNAPVWFFNLVLKPLIDENKIELKKLRLLQADDEIYAVKGHFILIALILKYFEKKNGSLNAAINSLKSQIGDQIIKLISKIEEAGEDI